jgi:acetolactate synthase-1/2/3 large subunit
MRLSDYVIQFLRDKYEIDTVFTVSGGGCIFLIDSLGTTEGVNYVATHHEQAAAIAAEGYARMNNKLGACIITSGPGGTNALTGTLCNWLDSIPVIYISGQVNKEMTTNYTGLPLRQLGDQEFNIIESVKNMTKYAVQVNDTSEIRYHLEKACSLATSGRPGPVWIDIPLNVQSVNIEPDKLNGYNDIIESPSPSQLEIDSLLEKWNQAKKPLMIVGNGIRLSGGIKELYKTLKQTNLPVISAVNGNDIVNHDYEHYCGRFGTHAQIGANNLLSECDFLLIVGSRLYVRQTGYNFEGFAKQAYKVHVDIDENELNKPTLFTNLKINSDAKEFLKLLNSQNLPKTDADWLDECFEWSCIPKVLPKHRNKTEYASHYAFIEKLSESMPKDHHIVTSDGSANVVTMQVMNLKGNQRLITNTGCAPMGYGLPAALGAATHHKVVCIEGDGSLHLNIHELQTMKHYNLPIKLILLNNDGYASIKISQKAFFNGRFVASEKNSGVSFPNFEKVIKAYDLPYYSIKNNQNINPILEEFLSYEGPAVLEVFTDPEEFHEPKVVAKLGVISVLIPKFLTKLLPPLTYPYRLIGLISSGVTLSNAFINSYLPGIVD